MAGDGRIRRGDARRSPRYTGHSGLPPLCLSCPPAMSRLQRFAEHQFPQARGRAALVSLIIAALGLAGGVVTIGLILFAR